MPYRMIAIDLDGQFDGGADAGVMIGIVAYIALPAIGLGEHAADRRIAASRGCGLGRG